MSGPKQHYIPQLFLDGFAAPGKGKHPQLTVYKCGQPPFRSSTVGVAAERFFYSSNELDDAFRNLDKILSNRENNLKAFIDDILLSSNLESVKKQLSYTIVSLSARTSATRKILTKLMKRTIEIAAEFSLTEETLVLNIGTKSSGPSGAFLSTVIKAYYAMETELKERGITLSKWVEITFSHAIDNRNDVMATQRSAINLLLENERKKIPELMANSHKKSLISEDVISNRIEELSNFHWIEMESNEQFVLSDCVALAYSTFTKDWMPYFMCGIEDIQKVYFPITARKAAFGSRGKCNIYPEIEDLNIASCVNASDFAMSHGSNTWADKNYKIIGKISWDRFDKYLTTHLANTFSTPNK